MERLENYHNLEENRKKQEQEIIDHVRACVYKHYQPQNEEQKEALEQAIEEYNLLLYFDLYGDPTTFIRIKQEEQVSNEELILEYIDVLSHFMANSTDEDREKIANHYQKFYPQIKKVSIHEKQFILDTVIGTFSYYLLSDVLYQDQSPCYRTLLTSERNQRCYDLAYQLAKEKNLNVELGMVNMHDFQTPHCINKNGNDYWDATKNMIMNQEDYQRLTNFQPILYLSNKGVQTLPETIQVDQEELYSLYVLLLENIDVHSKKR